MSARLAAIIVTVIILPLSQVPAQGVAARALIMMLREDPWPTSSCYGGSTSGGQLRGTEVLQ